MDSRLHPSSLVCPLATSLRIRAPTPCQIHTQRNVLESLPQAQRPWVQAILTRAYTHRDVKAARRLLQDLARRLDTDHPSAATSVREGLDETLTILGFGLSERLQRSALLHESELARTDPDPPFLHRPMRYDIGLPSTVI